MTPRPEIRIVVRVTPRGGADRVDGVQGGVLHVRVAAAPAEGAANDALLRLLARALDLPPTTLRIVRGATSRTKTIAVSGGAGDRIATLWPDLGYDRGPDRPGAGGLGGD